MVRLVCYLFVISTSVIDCMGRFVPEMTYYVSSGTLNLTKLKLGMYVCLSVRQSVCRSVSVCLSISQSIGLSVVGHRSVGLLVCLSVCRSVVAIGLLYLYLVGLMVIVRISYGYGYTDPT